MNMNNSYPTTVYESTRFSTNVRISGRKYYLQFFLKIVFIEGDLTSSVRRKYCMDSYIPVIHCSSKTVAHVQVSMFA